MAKVAKKIKPAEDETETPGVGHNSGGIQGKRLRQIVEKVERLEQDKSDTAEDIKEVYTMAKGIGFDVKTIRQIVKIRKMDREKLRAEKELLEIYMFALDPELAEVLS